MKNFIERDGKNKRFFKNAFVMMTSLAAVFLFEIFPVRGMEVPEKDKAALTSISPYSTSKTRDKVLLETENTTEETSPLMPKTRQAPSFCCLAPL